MADIHIQPEKEKKEKKESTSDTTGLLCISEFMELISVSLSGDDLDCGGGAYKETHLEKIKTKDHQEICKETYFHNVLIRTPQDLSGIFPFVNSPQVQLNFCKFLTKK